MWAFGLLPLMWRWKVRLPRERRLLDEMGESRSKQRHLRRIDRQLAHFGARRSGTLVFLAITVAMLVGTLTIFLLPIFSSP